MKEPKIRRFTAGVQNRDRRFGSSLARRARGGGIRFVGALLLVGTGLSIAATSSASKVVRHSTLPEVTVVLAWYPTAEYGGLYAAVAQGYFQKEGVNVKITPGGPAVNSATVVAAGRAQVGFNGSDADVLTGAASYPFVEIGTEFQISPEGVEFSASNPITSFTQLQGKTLGIIPGTPGWLWMSAKYHLKNVKLGPFDYSLFIHNPKTLEYGYVTDDIPTLAAQGTKAGYLLPANFGYNDNGDVIFVTKSYLSGHRAVLQKFMYAMAEGWRYYGTHYTTTDKVIYALDKSVPLSVENAIAKMELPFIFAAPATTHGLLYISPTQFTNMYNVLRSLKVITKSLPVAQLVDPLASASVKPPA